MRYRAAAVVLALAAAVAVGQVPMYSDYPWGLLNNGTDQGPVWNLDCKGGLWCHLAGYGNGVIELGDGGVLPITVLFAQDAGQALLAGFANYAADAGLSNRAITSDFAADAGFSLQAGLAVYALDAGLAGRSFTADFASDAGFAIFAGDAGRAYLSNFSDYASDAGYSQSAGLAGVATYALDAGLANKAIAADFARDAGSAANADFARDAGSAASADVATFALDAGRSVFAGFAADAGLALAALYAGDAGNLQCTTCVDATDIATAAVTTPKLAALAVTAAKLDDGPSLSAYDEATVSGVYDRSTATNCTKGTYDGSTSYIRFTVGTSTTNPQVSTTVYTGTSTNSRTPTAVMRYRLSGGFTSAPPSVIRAINNASIGQTADAPGVVADGAWHTATFDTSGWTTAGTLRVDLLLPSTLASTGYWDIAYLGSGVVGSGTGALVSYQGSVGINASTPEQKLDVRGGTAVNAQVYADSAGATRADLRLRVNNTTGDNYITFGDSGAFDVGRIQYNHNSNYLALFTNSLERVRIDSDGMVAVNKPSGGKASIYSTGVDTVYQSITTTSSTAASFPQQQIVNYSANGGYPVLGMYNSRGTQASPSGLNSGDALGAWAHIGRTAAAFATGSSIDSVLTAAPGLSALTAALRFSTANNGANSERVRITADGSVGIGTPTPGDIFEAVKSASGGWAAQLTNSNTASNTTKTVGLELRGTDTVGTEKQAALVRAVPNDSNYVGASLVFSTRASDAVAERARISSAGNLGIGGTPSVRLHTFATNENFRMEGTDPWASFYQSGTRKGWWGYGSAAATPDWSFVNEVAAGDFVFDTNGGAYTFYDFAGGGTTTASINNNGDLIRTVSDERLKEGISDLSRGLDAVLRMRPVRFQWRDKETYGDRWDIGFIAQEMIASVPEAVSKNPDGMYSLDYQKLIAVVVGAIQELFDDRTWLARRVQELEDRAQKAEDKLAQLEARLTSLENYSGIKGCGDCPQTDDGGTDGR